MRSAQGRKYWFAAKRHGYGWGLPSAWQGWVVLGVYVVLALGGIPRVQAVRGNLVYLGYLSVLTAGFVAICWITGEPPRWRAGGRDS